MPRMNGIELSRYLYENHRSTRVILLSGHSEFEYAQKALQYPRHRLHPQAGHPAEDKRTGSPSEKNRQGSRCIKAGHPAEDKRTGSPSEKNRQGSRCKETDPPPDGKRGAQRPSALFTEKGR